MSDLQHLLRTMALAFFGSFVARSEQGQRVTREPESPSEPPARGVLRVNPNRDPLWQQRRWQRKRSKLTGAYRTRHGSFAGEIDERHGVPQFFIKNPPRQVLTGPHAACFRERAGGLFFVHFAREPRNTDAGIAAVEKLLDEALRHSHPRSKR